MKYRKFISGCWVSAKVSIKCKYFLKPSTVEIQDKTQELVLTLKKNVTRQLTTIKYILGIKTLFPSADHSEKPAKVNSKQKITILHIISL